MANLAPRSGAQPGRVLISAGAAASQDRAETAGRSLPGSNRPICQSVAGMGALPSTCRAGWKVGATRQLARSRSGQSSPEAVEHFASGGRERAALVGADMLGWQSTGRGLTAPLAPRSGGSASCRVDG
jgi:hypothetical protein